MPKYDLSTLKEFSEAIVYAFDPEASKAGLEGSDRIEDALYPQIGQHVDVLNAYMYAQDSILPDLKKGFDKLTPSLIVSWIVSIHKLIGMSILASDDLRSGEFCKATVVVWKSTSDIAKPVFLFLSQPDSISIEKFSQTLPEQYGVDKRELAAFMRILLKIQNDRSPPFQMISQSSPSMIDLLTFAKLQHMYHLDMLSAEEKAAIESIVRIGTPPEKIESAMNAYGKWLINEMKSVDPNDLDSVIKFVSESFYQIVDIHPFPNANGRTATCLMNILLRFFNQPSILLRYPRELKNPQSSYSQAFKSINLDRERFRKHIKQRLENEKKKPYSDLKRKLIIELRVGLLFLTQGIQTNYPKVDVNAMYEKAINETPHFLFLAYSEEQQSILMLQSVIGKLTTIKNQLDKEGIAIKSSVIAKLSEITGSNDWKAFKKGTLFILENLSEALTTKIAEILNKTGAMVVTTMRRADTKIPVVTVENVNLTKLLEYEIQEQPKEPKPAIGPSS